MKRIRLENIPVAQEIIDELLDQNPGLSDDDREKVVREVKAKNVFKYKAVLISAMRSPLSSTGLSIEEIERTLPILTAIKAVEEGGVLELDDKDFEYIELKLSAVRINGFDDRWVRLKHVIKNASKDLLDGK